MVLLISGAVPARRRRDAHAWAAAHRRGELARRFAHTLVPIAMAYVVAHYFSLLAYQGQAIAPLASDPLGHGSDLLGTASVSINYTWITATGIWYVQVGRSCSATSRA